MSRDFTDDIDDCCNAIVGHTNWAFADKPLVEKIIFIVSNNILTFKKVDLCIT